LNELSWIKVVRSDSIPGTRVLRDQNKFENHCCKRCFSRCFIQLL